MQSVNFNNAEFIKSAATKEQFIKSSCKSVVFSGKSNVGKSSVINRLLNRKNFARVGNTPGKTVHVNYFQIDNKLFFIDLPGYGFAKVSKAESDRWSKLMEDFFIDASSITLGILIVDSRHKPTSDDLLMADWFKTSGCKWIVLANKIDKLKKSELSGNIEIIRNCLDLDKQIKVIPFSAENGYGRDLLIAEILNLC